MLRDPRPAARWRRHSRRVRILSYLATGVGVMIASFQNFEVPRDLTHVTTPLERSMAQAAHWSQARAESESYGQPSTDIRDLAPQPALPNDQMIAAPGSGSDLGSIGQDWATRQAHLMTGGGDERLLADINKKLNHLWQDDAAAPGEKRPESASAPSRGPASVTSVSDADYDALAPKSVRLTALNRVQVDWANNMQLGCSVQGTSLLLDLSRPLGSDLNLNLHHETNGSKSTVNVSYRW